MIRKLNISQFPLPQVFMFLVFILAAGYFMSYGSYILSFQKEQYLFVYSFSYLREFFLHPGGLLELTGKFLTQFYSSQLLGALILAFIIIAPGLLINSTVKSLNSSGSLFLPVTISGIMFLMQTNYNHMMEYNAGFVAVLLMLLLSVKLSMRSVPWILLVMFPVFCYFAGGVYSILFLAAYLIFILFYRRDIKNLTFFGLLLFSGIVTFLLFKYALFLLLPGKLTGNPMPLLKDKFHDACLYLLCLVIVLSPVLPKLAGLRLLRHSEKTLVKTSLAVIIVIIVILITNKTYNKQISRVITIEQFAFDEKWNELIDFQEKTPSVNKVGQYFYNVALAETGQLCNRLFSGRQDFKESSVALPWSDDFLVWGGYFFYTTGLVNEAHRWAYEEMVVYNPRPHNIKMLVKTNLVNGNYKMADKYLSMLKKTIFYRSWASQYAQCISDSSTSKIDPEFSAKQDILPQSNFYVYLESPEANLPALFEANNKNKTAFEYMMAFMMLSKNVESVAATIKMLKPLGYTKIPRHLEEAVMIYYNSKKTYPDLGGLSISETTQHNFDAYFRAYVEARKNPSTMKERMRSFGNTFWYYYHFS
jgi:hypothetical protein